MKVQVINKKGDVIWDFDVSRPPDDSGNSWRNGGHVIMFGILYTLRRAVSQAEDFPKEAEWLWPFSILPDAEITIQKVGQRVAFEEPAPNALACSRPCRYCGNNSRAQ